MKPLVLQGHSRPIKDIKFSNKGDIIYTASNDRNVIMWKTETGEKIKTFPHSAAVNRIAITCDMKYMITGDNTGSLYIWEINTALCLIKLEQDPTYCIRSIDLTLNDYFIMILYASRMKNSKSFICVYKFQDIINLALSDNLGEKEELNQTNELVQNDDFFDGFKSKKRQNSGNPLLNSQNSLNKTRKNIDSIIMNTNPPTNSPQTFKMINLNSNSNITASNFKPIQPNAITTNANTKSQQTTINIDLSNAESANKIELFKYIECKIKETKYVQAKFSNLNKCLLVSREDGFLELINFNNGKLITEMKFHSDVIMDFDIDLKNGIILTASIDGYSCVINIDTFQVVKKFHPLNPTRNLNTCKIITLDNPAYDPENDKKKSDMFSEKNINNFVYNLFNPNPEQRSNEMVQLDIDSLFNSTGTTESKKNLGINTKDKEFCLSIISGGQDSKLVTTTNQKEGGFDVLIYNSFTGENYANFQDHFGPINSLACNQHAKILASGAEDATIRIYKLENFLFNLNEKK